MSRPLASLLSRATNPAILPIPARSTGNNVPKSLHKTRRTWRPNVTRSDWAIDVLRSEGAGFAESSAKGSHRAGDGRGGMIRGVKMQMRRVRDVEKAGGVEGLLLSRPARDLTPFGRKLRAALFDDLHRLREELQESGAVGGTIAASEIANGQAEVSGKAESAATTV
ncbi:hypothetical protein JCM24511_07584 [Saitozyma sp. JCM 24511]|nr:hypothetical protein JCM24511_07584 [Saitozyma sp. JCM 24511]